MDIGHRQQETAQGIANDLLEILKASAVSGSTLPLRWKMRMDGDDGSDKRFPGRSPGRLRSSISLSATRTQPTDHKAGEGRRGRLTMSFR